MSFAHWLTRARSVGRSTPVAVGLLVIANLVPLLGILYFGWDVAMVLIAYWLENGIVGVLNVPKILLAARSPAGSGNPSLPIGRAAFFIVHYGIFWMVHGVFVLALTGATMTAVTDPLPSALSIPGVALIATLLLVSHAASFWTNYLGRREYLRTTPDAQAVQPYVRLVILHLTVLFGGWLVLVLGQPVGLIVLLVMFKTVTDLVLHLREHARAQRVRTLV